MKTQLTCVRCGFLAFVDRESPKQAIGWRLSSTSQGRGVCPACVGEEEPDEIPPVKAKSA
jgi:hypothetical protein